MSFVVLGLCFYNLIAKQLSSLKVLKTLGLGEPPPIFEELDIVLYKSKTSRMIKEYAGTLLVVQTDGGAGQRVATAGFLVLLLSG